MENLVAFFEIPADDFNRAVQFYQSVFSINMETFECEKEKMAFFPAGKDGLCPGAISWAPDFKPSSGGVLLSLQCADINNTLAVTEEKGGKIIIPKTKIEAENRGFFAVFEDCGGNRIGLYADK